MAAAPLVPAVWIGLARLLEPLSEHLPDMRPGFVIVVAVTMFAMAVVMTAAALMPRHLLRAFRKRLRPAPPPS